MVRVLHIVPILATLSCAAVLLQEDGFGDRLNQGCSTPVDCRRLVEDAQLRQQQCEPNTIGKLRCADTDRDFLTAKRLLEDVEQREEARGKAIASKKAAEKRQRASQRDAARRSVEAAFNKIACELGEESKLDGALSTASALRDEQKPDCGELEDCYPLENLVDKIEASNRNCLQRLDYERKRLATRAAEVERQEKEAAHKQILHDMAGQKQHAVSVLSVALCREAESISYARSQLNEQARIERASGAANLSARRELGETIVNSENLIRGYRKALAARWKAAALPCTSVATIDACIDDANSCSQQDALLGELHSNWLEAML